jgi:hypothetical protein
MIRRSRSARLGGGDSGDGGEEHMRPWLRLGAFVCARQRLLVLQ